MSSPNIEEQHKKELFELFQNKENDYKLHLDVEMFIEKMLMYYVQKNKAYYYTVLVALSNSINNAGHEERRSKDIDRINKEQKAICKSLISSGHEDLLP